MQINKSKKTSTSQSSGGLFDDDFFMYYEETEMQLRYKNKGFKSMLISGPQIIHLEPNLKEYSKKRYTTKQRYIYFEGMFLYYKKTTSKM